MYYCYFILKKFSLSSKNELSPESSFLDKPHAHKLPIFLKWLKRKGEFLRNKSISCIVNAKAVVDHSHTLTLSFFIEFIYLYAQLCHFADTCRLHYYGLITVAQIFLFLKLCELIKLTPSSFICLVPHWHSPQTITQYRIFYSTFTQLKRK